MSEPPDPATPRDATAPPVARAAPPTTRPRWQRVLWLLAGLLSLLAGIVGIFLPLLPTTPFVLLAAFCFARGSRRCEQWLLEHRLFGPMVRDWRANHAVPLRAKQWSAVMMVIGCAFSAWLLPLPLAWVPAAFCVVVSIWLWRLPSRGPDVVPEHPARRSASQ